MSFRWTDNDLDNSLFAEFTKDKPDEKKVRNLITKGANINAVDSKGDSVLIDAISNIQDGLDTKFIQLIIVLGADIDNAEEGFNCLFDAALTQRPEVVELLLKAGANPNCVSSDTAESLLDWAEFDQFFEETEDRGGAEPMKKIVQLLKDYGAKSISEIFADKPEKFLTVFAGYNPTGLYTLKGYLKPENISNADKNFVDTFSTWVATNPDKWDEYKYENGVKILNPPDLSVLRQHNEQGRQLAKAIRKMVNPDIEVKYYFVNPDDLEKNRVRNVEHITIADDK